MPELNRLVVAAALPAAWSSGWSSRTGAVGFELANPGPVGVARAPTIGEEKSGKLRKLKRLTGEGIVQGNASLITTSNQSPYRHCGFSRRPKARRTASTSRMSTAACTVALSSKGR